MILLSFAYAKLSSIIPPLENVKKEFLKFLKKFLKIQQPRRGRHTADSADL